MSARRPRTRRPARDAVYFAAPMRGGGVRVVTVREHGRYHDTRPASWRGPYPTAAAALAATEAWLLATNAHAQSPENQAWLAPAVEAAAAQRDAQRRAWADAGMEGDCPRCGQPSGFHTDDGECEDEYEPHEETGECEHGYLFGTCRACNPDE